MSDQKYDKFRESVSDALVQRENAVVDRMTETFQEAAKPVDEARISVTEDKGEEAQERSGRPYGSVQTRVAEHPLYARLPEAERAWRSPESDYHVQQWMVGLKDKRIDLMLEAHDKLGAIYGRQEFERDWAVGTPDTGGGIASGTGAHTVPTPLLNVIMINRDQVAKIPGLSTSFQLTAMQARIPTVDTATVAMVGEGATAAVNNPTQASILPRSNKMQGQATFTDEQLSDSAFNSVSLVAQRMGSAMGFEEDTQACTSTGTAPNIQHTIRQGITVSDNLAAALTYADVAGLYFGVGQQYRMDGVWFVDTVGASILTKIAQTDGYPIFSTQSTVPGAITDDSADGFVFRKPVYEVPLVAGAGSGVIIFMSRSSYGWGRRQGMTARASEHTLWSEDRVAYKFTQRVEGVKLDPGGSNGASGVGIENIT